MVAPVLRGARRLGLAPRADADELEAAAAVCRSAGYWAIPYPVAERLARPADSTPTACGRGWPLGPPPPWQASSLRWAAVRLDGARSLGIACRPIGPPRDGAFVAELELGHADEHGAKDAALGLVLPCWTLLGMLDRAIDLTRAHVLVREQFGQSLAAFQGCAVSAH